MGQGYTPEAFVVEAERLLERHGAGDAGFAEVAGAERALLGQPQLGPGRVAAVVQPLPAQVPVVAADHAQDPERVVVVDRGRLPGGEAGQHQGAAARPLRQDGRAGGAVQAREGHVV
ncbi:MAG TPA: hypothetical protein VFD04_12825, partial [Actinomycetes bacterium]|nr:hypothetical protein [Actinomycetes bacterium]